MAMDEKQSGYEQNKITEMVKQLSPEVIKSITGYDVYTKTFFEYF